MRLSCCLISHLRSAQGSTGTVSHISSPRYFSGLTRPIDWAYLEDWCRRLTGTFSDVYVFTIPLYLPKLEPDGKWRVVSLADPTYFTFIFISPKYFFAQTHEIIGSPPNVSVPTHFAKVVLASKPSSPASPDIPEISTGAFVLPNAVISDETPLESFVMPGELNCSPGGRNFLSCTDSGSRRTCCRSHTLLRLGQEIFTAYLPDGEM